MSGYYSLISLGSCSLTALGYVDEDSHIGSLKTGMLILTVVSSP